MTASANPMGGLLNPMANPGVATNPDFVSQMLHVSRQQALAQELMQQGIAPISYDPKGKISPLQGMSKMLAAALGGYEGNQAQQGQADLMSQGAQAAMAQYGGGAPAQGPTIQPAQPSAATQALGAGAAAGSVGPTVSNAQRLAQALQGQPAAAPQGPQAPLAGPQGWRYTGPGAVAPTAMNPSGLPPTLLFAAASGNPAAKAQVDAYTNAAGKNLELTPDQKNWLATGADPAAIGAATNRKAALEGRGGELTTLQYQLSQLPPGSPQAQQLQAAIAKATYVAPVEVKPGNLAADPFTLQPRLLNPKVEDGVQPTFGTDANGYTSARSVSAIPGYAGAVAGIGGAKTGAMQENTVGDVTNPDGSITRGYNKQTLGPAPASAGPGPNQYGAPPGASNPATFNVNPNGVDLSALREQLQHIPDPTQRAQALAAWDAKFPPNAAPVPAPGGQPGPGPRTGPTPTDAALQKAGADPIANAPNTLSQSKSAVTGLNFALDALKSVPATGPGTVKTADVLAALNNAGIPIKSDGVNNYQALAKYLSNSLNTASEGTGASGSDARFESFSHGQPNQETMNKTALEGAIRYVQSQHDAAIARSTYLPQAYQAAKAAGDPTASLTAQKQWSTTLNNPKFFSIQRMAPADQAAAVGALSPQEASQFIKWRKQIQPLLGQ